MLLPDWLVDSADTTTSRQFCETRSTGYLYGNFKLADLAFDCVRGTCPSYFRGVCTPLTEVSGRLRLRSVQRGDLYVPATRTKLGTRSFQVAASEIWNYLPTETSPFINHQPRSVPDWTQIPPAQVHLHMIFPPGTIEE